MAEIKFNVELCIGCGACASTCDNWVMEGEKAKPLKTRLDPGEVAKNKEAAAVCPVACIEVVE